MKRLIALAFLVISSALSFASESSQALNLAEQLSSAFRGGSIAKSDAVFTEDAAVFWIHQKFAGVRKFDKYLEGQFASSDKQVLAFDEQGTVEDETISTSWGSFLFEYGKSDTPVSSRFVGRYTIVAQKVDGAWKIVSLHLSLPNPPDLPAVIN